MNQKTFIKLGNKIYNIDSLISIDFSEEEKSVLIALEKSEHKIKFGNEKEFERFKTYMRMISNEFESAEEITVDNRKKTVLG